MTAFVEDGQVSPEDGQVVENVAIFEQVLLLQLVTTTCVGRWPGFGALGALEASGCRDPPICMHVSLKSHIIKCQILKKPTISKHFKENNVMHETNKSLEQRLNDCHEIAPESWKPQPGDLIVGQLLRYEIGDSPFGSRWIAFLKVDACADRGEWVAAVWLSHKVLVEKFKTLQPKPGERVGIRRLDDAKDADGKMRYARYTVIVDGRNAEPDWDALDPNETENGRDRLESVGKPRQNLEDGLDDIF